MNKDSEKDKISILGVKISTLNKNQVLEKINFYLLSQEKYYIVTPNPEFLMAAQKEEKFRNILNKADLSISDGVGLLWASSFLRSKSKLIYLSALYYGLLLILWPRSCQKIIPERISGTDLVFDIAELCEQSDCSLFLLGAQENIAEACAMKLKQKYNNLKIAGTYSGNPEQKYDNKMVHLINKAKPDVLLVAYGHPKQEKWISRNLDKLETVRIAMGVGGAFDFISGKVKRAPKMFRKLGLEWFYRVIKQPWRLNRILTATWRFSKEVIKYKISNRKNNE